jgi:phosphate transport system permease protein
MSDSLPPSSRNIRAPRRRITSPVASVISRAEPAMWFTGGAVVICLAMILSLLGFVILNGASTFWPGKVVRVSTLDNQILMGEITRRGSFRPEATLLEQVPESARANLEATNGLATRKLVRIGNYELTGEHFQWVSDFMTAPDGISYPEWVVLLERQTWGRFYGFPERFFVGDTEVASDPAAVWQQFQKHHGDVRARWERRRHLEKHEIGKVNHELEKERLSLSGIGRNFGVESAQYAAAQDAFAGREAELQAKFKSLTAEIATLNQENARYRMILKTADGKEKEIKLDEVVRALTPNRLSTGERLSIYFSRWGEYLTAEPREANSEGGVWPAIFGTVMMTLIMALLVAPVGVLAALYLREYAKPGPLVTSVRIAINNLAGVPSIVFGVFGLGFFCYIMGGSIDQVFFQDKLPSPTYGTGGILWASLTLALLTLPVVIVATEEALSAVPNSMREGSYACGGSKWQTIQRIVLPRAMPGVMTGMILAMARGAGEVAPLMLVGAVKLAPELPFDGIFPFFHLERSFMHLGFHIYDLGFQSQNSEAAKPMVFTTTLLLIFIIITLNAVGIIVRARLKKRFKGSSV